MTDAELKAIEARWAGFEGHDATRLVAEVRRLNAQLAQLTLEMVPMHIAQGAVLSGQDAVVERLARLLDARGRRDAAEFIRLAWRETSR